MKTIPAPDSISSVLGRTFPITVGAISLEIPTSPGDAPTIHDDDALHVTLRLIVWDGHGPSRAVRDIKEQRVMFCDRRVHELEERLEAGLQAHAIVLTAAFEDASRDTESWHPSDCIFPGVFRLKTARTVEDFTRALAAKSRLDVPALR